MKPKEERVRAVAHEIWQEVGRPKDEADLHWELAQLELQAEAEKKPAELPAEREKLPVLKAAPLV